jgi:hypothetical protein
MQLSVVNIFKLCSSLWCDWIFLRKCLSKPKMYLLIRRREEMGVFFYVAVSSLVGTAWLYGATSQKIALFILIAMRTSNLTWIYNFFYEVQNSIWDRCWVFRFEHFGTHTSLKKSINKIICIFSLSRSKCNCMNVFIILQSLSITAALLPSLQAQYKMDQVNSTGVTGSKAKFTIDLPQHSLSFTTKLQVHNVSNVSVHKCLPI